MENLYDERREYKGESTAKQSDPFSLFSNLIKLAIDKNEADATSMILSTSFEDHVSSRVVLLKEHSISGFKFFGGLLSQKGQEIKQNPNVALLFYWPTIFKQVRVQGKAEQLSRGECEEYFKSRPLESQVAAVTMAQSQKIESRETLGINFNNKLEKAKGSNSDHENKVDLSIPNHWGGWKVIPNYFEFFTGKESRLHERLVYEKNESEKDKNLWSCFELSP